MQPYNFTIFGISGLYFNFSKFWVCISNSQILEFVFFFWKAFSYCETLLNEKPSTMKYIVFLVKRYLDTTTYHLFKMLATKHDKYDAIQVDPIIM